MGKSPFLWGDNGAALTPAQVADRRRIAEALAGQASDTSPVGHWTAALNRGLQGYFAGKDNKSAQAAEAAGMAEANALAAGIGMGGASPVAAALAGGGQMQHGAGYTAPAEAAEIRAGLLARGLPEHIADGFIMNMQDESGLNPGINEANPIVPGSRGGFGLYQLTGPRRVAYEGFAADRGVDPSDTNAQLDFLMSELQGPESRAAKAIFSTKDAGSAGAAIVNHFLRPAEEHRTARANRYMGAGSGVSQAPSAPNVSGLASAMGNPWFKERYGDVASALMNQQMQQQNEAYRQQLVQQDPSNQVALEMAQLELDRARNPGPAKPIEVGGVLLDANTYQPIFDSRSAPAGPSSVQEYEYYAQGANARGEAPMPYENYQALMARAGSGAADGMGSIPAGYQAVRDPLTGNVTGLQAIPGGPAEIEYEQNRAAKEARELNTANSANVVLQDIEKAIGQTSGWTSGLGGSILGKVPGTGATDLRATIDTVKANIGFDRLQQMRDSSPTGGALGGIAVQELNMLQAVLGSLDQSQSDEQLKANLERLRDTYAPIAAKAAAYPNASQYGFGGAAQRGQAMPQTPQPPAQPMQQGQPVQIGSRAEFDALPSGATFVAPDGSVRRKP